MGDSLSRLAAPVLGFAVMMCGAPLLAQDKAGDKAGGGAQSIEAFRSCRAITDPAARLACFDTAAGDLVAAVDRGEVRVMDKDAVQKTKRRLFGFALPDLGIFGDGDDDDEPEMDMLETTITSVANRGGSNWTFSTPEGGTWEIRNAPFSFRDPKPGDKVVFKRAALGSYFIRINDRIGVKGRRVS